MKQVEKAHYDFSRYQSPRRFTSYYYQISALLELNPCTVVEIGVGDRTFITLAKNHGVRAFGMDFDLDLSPSLCASALYIPIRDASIDVFAAFQILEHLPYHCLSSVANEMYRVCRKGTIVSLPDFGNASININIPLIRHLSLSIRHFFPIRLKHKFDGEHYWEISKQGYPLSRIINTFTDAGFICKKTWLNPFFPYHRFFIFEKCDI